MRLRRRRGSAVALGTVLALALLVIGVGFLFMSLYMGGQNETKNAVDAGALNVGKQAVDNVSVDLGPQANEQCFADVCSDDPSPGSKTDGRVTLRRINRLWAKAMLMAINANAAQKDGNAGAGAGNAQQAYEGVKGISERLSAKLTTPSNLYGFFTDVAQLNSVRMIGKGARVDVRPGNEWQTSYMDRGNESNISLSNAAGFNLPPGYVINPGYTTESKRKTKKGKGLSYLKGYEPLAIDGKTFWFVPFALEQRPHLVSGGAFDQLKKETAPLAWDKPVPNAFSASGIATQGGVGETATSWVLSNPRQTYQMSIPHSFLHIKLDEMKTHWYFFPFGPFPRIEFGKPQTYGYTTDTQTGTPMPHGGVLSALVSPGQVTVGLDVVGRNLYQIIFGPPSGDTAQVEAYMTNRVNEMLSASNATISFSDLKKVLSDPLTIGWMLAGERDFYVFSTDGKKLTVQPKAMAMAMAPWLATKISNTADGNEKRLIDDATSIAPIFFTPAVTPDPLCTLLLALGWGTWDKDVYWTPGTGYNGCLGEIRVKRWTDVYSLGVCVPL
ncbi:MAG TPA: hypothetical protein V6D17_03625 [Candidatus Obscuribacterales bacterium]